MHQRLLRNRVHEWIGALLDGLHRHELGGSPTRVLLTDRPLLLCVALWLAVAALVIRVG